MSFSLIIAGWALAIIAASTLVWHRRREHAARCAWAREHGLTIYPGRGRDLADQLRGLTLMQVGHSRRIEAAFVTPKGDFAVCYHCQTGFEQNRYLHRWLIAAVPMHEAVEHDRGGGRPRQRATEEGARWSDGPKDHERDRSRGRPVRATKAGARTESDGVNGSPNGDHGGIPNGRAVVTAQDWLVAASHSTSGRVLAVGPAEQSSGTIALVEDADAWRPRLEGEIGRWLQAQPTTRNWEIVPGWVVGYEPGHAEGQAILSLSAATKELASRLCR